MKRLFAVFILLAVGTTSANAVTVDFEEFNIGDGAGLYPTVLQSQGFVFAGRLLGSPDSTEVLIGSSNGTNAYGGSLGGSGQDGFGYGAEVEIERSGGGAFAIHSLDLVMSADPSGYTFISGELFGGGFTNLTNIAVGTGDWLNLQSVAFRAEGNQFGLGGGSVEIDNVVISAVPIPAAVWLFGSALAGLGWLRRKTAA